MTTTTHDPIVVPERIAIRLMTTDVVQGKPDAGASQWLTVPRESGYLVGIPALSLTFGPHRLVDVDAVMTWVGRVARIAHDAAYAIDPVTVGSWVNPDTGAVCFDASSWHERTTDAGRAAHKRNEHSYWDIANARVVRVAGHGWN